MKPLIKLLKKRDSLLEELEWLDFEMEGNFPSELFQEQVLCKSKLDKLQKKIRLALIRELEMLE